LELLSKLKNYKKNEYISSSQNKTRHE
jgi:hypothetical protein